MNSYILGIVSSLLLIALIFELLRRGSLRERHAVWWIFAGIIAVVLSFFPAVLDFIAQALGVEVPLNLVLFAGIAVLLVVNLQHSAEISRLDEKTRVLAEEIALIKAKDSE